MDGRGIEKVDKWTCGCVESWKGQVEGRMHGLHPKTFHTPRPPRPFTTLHPPPSNLHLSPSPSHPPPCAFHLLPASRYLPPSSFHLHTINTHQPLASTHHPPPFVRSHVHLSSPSTAPLPHPPPLHPPPLHSSTPEGCDGGCKVEGVGEKNRWVEGAS